MWIMVESFRVEEFVFLLYSTEALTYTDLKCHLFYGRGFQSIGL
jgi:hypothetical protein